MKDNSEFSLDDLFESDQPQPPTGKPAIVPAPPVVMLGDGRTTTIPDVRVQYKIGPSEPSKQGMGCVVPSVLVSIALAVGFGLGALVGSWRHGSDVEPNVDPVTGAYVAIFYQDSDLQEYSSSQREFLNSVNTANWLEEHKVNWKKIDVDEKVDRLPEPFPIMAEKHRSKEPWIVIAAGKKFASEPIESNEQAMKLLQKWVK